jgi:DNA replication protein DnaC
MSRGSPTSTRLPESGKPARELAAQFLFKLVSRRYLKGSIILTSNKSYGEWGDIFADQVLAAAILDRLLHHSTTINIRGQSYRLREKRKAGIFIELEEPHKEV